MASYQLSETAENLWAETFTFLSGTAVGDGICTQGHGLVGIQMPAVWTAASINYEVSVDGGKTWNLAYDAGGNIQQTIAEASAFICIPLSQAIFAPYLRLRSVAVASPPGNTPANQGQDTTLILTFKRFLGGS